MAFKRKFSKRWGKKKAPAKKRAMAAKRTFAKKVKRVILKEAEPKNRAWTPGTTQLNHNANGVVLMNAPSTMPPQGVRDDNRIGDQIYTIGYSVKMLLTQKSDRPNCTWRISFVRVPKGATYTYGTWYNNQTNVILLDDFNNDFVKVVKDSSFKQVIGDMDAGAVAREYTFVKKFWIPHKYLYKFGPADAAVTHNHDDLYMCIVCYDAAGTLITDNIGAYNVLFDLKYKDP